MPYHIYFTLFLFINPGGCNRNDHYIFKSTIGISYQNLHDEFVINIQDAVW